MSSSGPTMSEHVRTALIVGASRGIGHAMAAEFLRRGWRVIATVRNVPAGPLNDLEEEHGERLVIETLDIDAPGDLAALHDRLSSVALDVLFVNAGTTTQDEHVLIGDVSTEEFVRVMVTNSLSPMRVIEALQHLVGEGGVIGAMTSGQASIANNETAGREVYRASKVALNMLMRSFACRAGEPSRAIVALAPGWIRTALGGPGATFGLDETIPDIVDQLAANDGQTGFRYIDRFGQQIPY